MKSTMYNGDHHLTDIFVPLCDDYEIQMPYKIQFENKSQNYFLQQFFPDNFFVPTKFVSSKLFFLTKIS